MARKVTPGRAIKQRVSAVGANLQQVPRAMRKSWPQFRPGQIVVLYDSDKICRAPKGARALVTRHDKKAAFVFVKWTQPNGQSDGGYFANRFKLLRPQLKPKTPHKYSRVAMGKIKNGHNAVRWAVTQYDGDTDTIAAFLGAFLDGAVVTGEEWSEYRYWCTGVHE